MATHLSSSSAEKHAETQRRRERQHVVTARVIARTPEDLDAQVAVAAGPARAVRFDGPVSWVDLSSIVDSPHQERPPLTDEDVADLVGNLPLNGLLQPPIVRPVDGMPGRHALIAGHRRVAALRRLVAADIRTPALEASLRREDARVMIPAIRRTPENLDAHAQTIAENEFRKALTPWGRGQAYLGFRRALEEAGQPATLEALEARLSIRWSTVAPYVRIAESLSEEVLDGGGILPTEAARVLGSLTLETLRRIASPPTPQGRIERLRAMVAEAGRPAQCGGTAPVPQRGYQVNIRRPVEELSPQQAAKHAVSMSRVVSALVTQGLPALSIAERDVMRAELAAVVKALSAPSTRSGDS